MPRRTKSTSSNLVDGLNDQVSELAHSARGQVEAISKADSSFTKLPIGNGAELLPRR